MTASKVCVTLHTETWRSKPANWGGVSVEVIHIEDDVDNERYRLHYEGRPSERDPDHFLRPTNPDKTTQIAEWLSMLTTRHGISGWVIGKGTICHLTDLRAEMEGVKNVKHRRKLVYSICVEEVNPHEPKPCGNPIYEHGMDRCSIHARQHAKEVQEREQREAARIAAQNRIDAQQAEDDHVMEVATNTLSAVSSIVGVPYVRTVERWGRRKGELSYADIDIHHFSGNQSARRTIKLDLDMFIAICSKLTGQTIEILPPAAGDHPSTEPQVPQPAVAGDVQNPFA